MKWKHLTLEERNTIELRLKERETFKGIGRELCKDPTTIAKEVKNHIQFKHTGCYGKPFNDCINRRGCAVRHLCGNRHCRRYCSFCFSYSCSTLCPDYRKEICHRLSKPPYVCNGCELKRTCTLEKRIYTALNAQKEYEADCSESRQGIQITEEEAILSDLGWNLLLQKSKVNISLLVHYTLNET